MLGIPLIKYPMSLSSHSCGRHIGVTHGFHNFYACFFYVSPISIGMGLCSPALRYYAAIIFHHYVPEHGIIEQLHTGQRASFEAKLAHKVCEILQFRKTWTTGCHPNPMDLGAGHTGQIFV